MTERRVVVVGYDAAELLDIACITTSLEVANLHGARPAYHVRLASLGGRPVTCGAGLTLLATATLAARAGVSERHLTRLFLKHLGQAPGRFVRQAVSRPPHTCCLPPPCPAWRPAADSERSRRCAKRSSPDTASRPRATEQPSPPHNAVTANVCGVGWHAAQVVTAGFSV
jgi:hypothetical protein